MTTMYDSVNVASYPDDTTMALGYVDGHWPDASQVQARFPSAVVVRVTTSQQGSPAARVYDCEKGDGDAAHAAAWADRQIRAGNPRPCIYTSRVGTAGYGWPWVLAAVKSLGLVGQVDYGIADFTGEAHMVPGANVVFTQWGQGGNGAYDISVTLADWPVAPAPTPSKKGITMFITSQGPAQYLCDNHTAKVIADPADSALYSAAGVPSIPISAQEFSTYQVVS